MKAPRYEIKVTFRDADRQDELIKIFPFAYIEDGCLKDPGGDVYAYQDDDIWHLTALCDDDEGKAFSQMLLEPIRHTEPYRMAMPH